MIVRIESGSETFDTLQSHFGARRPRGGDDDDGLEAESQDRRSGCRRCRGHGYIERGVDDEGHEAEESPVHHKGPCEHGVKYRSKCKVCSACPHGRRRRQCKECGGASICEHGRRRSMQGVRWCINLRARSSALSVQGVRWGINLRARSYTLSVQGVRWVTNMRARSSALFMQGVRWERNLRSRSSAQ